MLGLLDGLHLPLEILGLLYQLLLLSQDMIVCDRELAQVARRRPLRLSHLAVNVTLVVQIVGLSWPIVFKVRLLVP